MKQQKMLLQQSSEKLNFHVPPHEELIGAFLFSCIIQSTIALCNENMTEEVNHPKSVFSPSWDHENMYVTLCREVLCFYSFFYPQSWQAQDNMTPACRSDLHKPLRSLTKLKHPVGVLAGITAKLQPKTKREFFSLIPAQLLHLYFHREGENRKLTAFTDVEPPSTCRWFTTVCLPCVTFENKYPEQSGQKLYEFYTSYTEKCVGHT